jgi:PAS domain S-box-containing protein
MSTTGLRVLVADDDRSVREALADLVSTQSDLDLLAVAEDHAETVRLATRLRPDVVIMDVRMPAGSGQDTLHRIRTESPGTAVIALSAFEDHESVIAMLASGAAGYQVKGSSDGELLEVVRRASRGQLSIPVDLFMRSFRGVLRDRDAARHVDLRSRPDEEMFHELLDRAPLGVVLVSPDGRIRLANAEAERVFRRGLSHLSGQSAAVLLARRFHNDFLTLLTAARDEGSEDPPAAEVAGLRGDSTEFPALIDVRVLTLGEERLAAVFVRSIGDAHEGGAPHQHGNELSTDSLIVIDADGQIELVDAQAETLFAYPQDELLGRSISLLIPGREMAVYLRERVTTTDPHARAGRPGAALTGVRRNGTEFPVQVGLSVMRRDQRCLVVATLRDLSEQQRNERVLERSLHVLQDMGRDHQLLLSHLVRAQEEERMRIAAGIHDDTLQAITAASLRLQQLRRRLQHPADITLLARLEETVQLSISRLRHLTFDLQPPASQGGLVSSLTGYLDQLRADTGVDVDMDNGLRTELSEESVVIAYRIAQEALNNVRTHAHARAVSLRLRSVDDGCLVTVEDDGVGYQPQQTESKPGHLGLTLMQERAQIAGGWCRIESAPGSGTTVEFWIPRDNEAAREDQPRPDALGFRP